MIVPHPDILSPSDDTPLWRYMDFTKFVALLDKQALYFCRGDILKDLDPYEGSYTKGEIEFLDAQAQMLFKGKPEVQYQVFSELNRRNSMTMLGMVFVNCWHANYYESIAMWRVFTAANTGIAIKTDYNSLNNSLSGVSKDIFAGVVQYIDHYGNIVQNAAGQGFIPITRKNLAYQYEQEVRLMIMHVDEKPRYEDLVIKGVQVTQALPSSIPGMNLPVNLNELIHDIYVDPKADPWFVELVGEVFNTYKNKHSLHIAPRIIKSKLSANDLELTSASN
ncbi:MAG: hypothetical protein P4N59_19005 [Negativicutes bacterium]|nr:hypothetical protein [Negativicutes bacterium]